MPGWEDPDDCGQVQFTMVVMFVHDANGKLIGPASCQKMLQNPKNPQEWIAMTVTATPVFKSLSSAPEELEG